ncbi:hypothetical protein ACAG25_19835 [Mycobacterium sp. pV006]|uniref:DUF7162 family protein n=1 Tax=Mycobacterium sp. pV006 TaxID=3238983 RepID=UPI00351AF291
MAEITHVDVDHVHRLAERVDEAAERLRGVAIPRLAHTALPGSAVHAVCSPQAVAGRVDEVATGLREWSAAARDTAVAFAGTDRANAARLGVP